MAKDYNNLNNYQSLENSTNKLYEKNTEFYLCHEFNLDLNSIENTNDFDNDTKSTENQEISGVGSNTIVESGLTTTISGAGATGAGITAGITTGVVSGVGIGAVTTIVVATVVTAGGNGISNILMPKISLSNIVLNYFDISFTYDANNVIDDNTSIMTFLDEENNSLYTETATLNNGENANNSHTVVINKLEDGKNYKVVFDYTNGTQNSQTSFDLSTPILKEPESIYGEISFNDYSVDYDKNILNYSFNIDDVNSYLSDIKVVAEAYNGVSYIGAANGAMSLGGFTKDYFISLKFTAISKHPRDVRDETQNKEFMGGVIYY